MLLGIYVQIVGGILGYKGIIGVSTEDSLNNL